MKAVTNGRCNTLTLYHLGKGIFRNNNHKKEASKIKKS